MNPLQQDQRMAYYWTQVRRSGEKIRQFDWPSVEVLLNLVYLNDILSARLSSIAADYGLSRAGINVLNILNRSETKGCKHHEISKLLLVSRANVTGLINSLIRKGFVQREYDASDRRVCIARITSAGEELLASFAPVYHKEIKRIFSGLSLSEKKTLNQLLGKVQETIQQTGTSV